MIEKFIALRDIHGLFDDSEKWLAKELGVLICIDNCGLCCEHNTVTIHSIEASLILSYLIGEGKTRIIDSARGWLLEKHSQTTIYEGMPHGLVTGKLREEWNALTHLPCIFLEADKKCAIHSFRPLVCRAYGVTAVPRDYCPRPLGKDEIDGRRLYVGTDPAALVKNEVDRFIKTLNPDQARMGFLPVMIFRQAREREFREMISDNKIATAKLVGTSDSTQSLFEKDRDFLWQMETELSKNIIKA